MPDAATLEALPYWAAGGAALGFGAVLFNWMVKPGVFGEVVREQPLHIPGAPKPDDPAPVPWGPAGLSAALVGAGLAALWAWGWYGGEDDMRRIGAFFAALGVLQSLRHLQLTVRDVPAVGEPPPNDPEKTVAARLPGALGGIALACLGVVMALL